MRCNNVKWRRRVKSKMTDICGFQGHSHVHNCLETIIFYLVRTYEREDSWRQEPRCKVFFTKRTNRERVIAARLTILIKSKSRRPQELAMVWGRGIPLTLWWRPRCWKNTLQLRRCCCCCENLEAATKARFVCPRTPKPRHAGAYWQKLEGLKPPGYSEKNAKPYQAIFTNFAAAQQSTELSLTAVSDELSPLLSSYLFSPLSLWCSTAPAPASRYTDNLSLTVSDSAQRSWQGRRSPFLFSLCALTRCVCLSNRLGAALLRDGSDHSWRLTVCAWLKQSSQRGLSPYRNLRNLVSRKAGYYWAFLLSLHECVCFRLGKEVLPHKQGLSRHLRHSVVSNSRTHCTTAQLSPARGLTLPYNSEKCEPLVIMTVCF